MTRMGVCLSSLFSCLKRGLTVSVPVLPISDAVHCNRPCSALHPPSQCTASFPANVCIRHRKRLHPGLQTLSSVLANVITEKTPSFKNLFPCFSTEPFWFSRYLVGAPMPQDWFYNSPRNIYRAVSFKTRIWTGWTDFVAW